MRVPNRTWWLAAAFALLVSVSAAAQTATVRSNVHLRKQASTASPSLELLHAGDSVTLLSPDQKNGFFHVQASDGTKGWAWAKFVHAEDVDEPPATTPAPPGAVPADSFSIDWEKPAPKGKVFAGSEGSCPADGEPDGDVGTNGRKNRIDVPTVYHAVTWKALATLPYPKAGKTRDKWSAEQLAVIEPYEGASVSVVGYLVAIKNQNGGTGESTNCHFTQSPNVDWHMALVENVGDGENTAIVVEPTPRLRKLHPTWTIPTLRPWVDSDRPVRISGWTLLDPEHRNHLNHYRSTLWEIHPITKIEVWDGTAWVDLDLLK